MIFGRCLWLRGKENRHPEARGARPDGGKRRRRVESYSTLMVKVAERFVEPLETFRVTPV